MIVETEYIEETATVKVVLKGKEIRDISETLQILLVDNMNKNIINSKLVPFLREVKKSIDNPIIIEHGDK